MIRSASVRIARLYAPECDRAVCQSFDGSRRGLGFLQRSCGGDSECGLLGDGVDQTTHKILE